MQLDIDNYSLSEFKAIAAKYGCGQFGFAVTPNVDHLIRFYDDPNFRALYSKASFVLLDSRLLARLARAIKRVSLQVCTGSDLTAALLSSVVQTNDQLVLVGGTAVQAQTLRERFGLTSLHHIDPPMGFIRDPVAIEECLCAIEAASPFRFCFIGVGSPQQEIVAAQLLERQRARGLALCIGASINFITGAEKRAPLWMQNLSMEWAYRLAQDPKRLARRYLVRGPRVFSILPRVSLHPRRTVPVPGTA